MCRKDSSYFYPHTYKPPNLKFKYVLQMRLSTEAQEDTVRSDTDVYHAALSSFLQTSSTESTTNHLLVFL